MNNGRIYLISQTEGQLIPMDETPYITEDILQVLLVSYPDLLPGDQITPDDPRRWLLVAREMGVPGDKDETGRWSLDHLFLDQDGIPTFVECKRSSDTRSRREVVAQMLDYAANGTEYWTVDRLRQAATETARSRGKFLDDEIRAFLAVEDDAEIDAFWQSVETNLRQGKVRLIFVADKTSKELRRLVEFLNEKMADVEVLAVEIKQFLGQNKQKALVPRVVGLTEAARMTKSEGGVKKKTTQSEFLAKCTLTALPAFERVLDLAAQKGYKIYWGTLGFSIRAYLPKAERFATFILSYPPDKFQFYFGNLPENEEMQNLRRELIQRGGFRESGGKTLTLLLQDEAIDRANQVYDFILEKIDELVKVY